MFDLGVRFEIGRGRLQDVGRWDSARGDAPSSVLLYQGNLGMGDCKAELAAIAHASPSPLVRPKYGETLCDLNCRQPLHAIQFTAQDGCHAIWNHKLHGARTVLANGADQPKRLACAHLKATRPLLNDQLVVGQQSPNESAYLGA